MEWPEYPGAQLSKFAVDGNKHTNVKVHACSHTGGGINPWWAVELDEPLDVVRVDIINRGDCCGEFSLEYKIHPV